LEKDHKKAIEEIIHGMKCPKDFECYNSRFESLCKAKDTDLESYIECLDEEAYKCEFSLTFGSSYLCRCPLRIYIARELFK
jgi:hypothetical protein